MTNHTKRSGIQKTIFLVIGSGWGIRTFLQTDVLAILRQQSHVVVLAHPSFVDTLKAELDQSIDVLPLKPFAWGGNRLGKAYEALNRTFLYQSMTGTRRNNLTYYRASLGKSWIKWTKELGLHLKVNFWHRWLGIGSLRSQLDRLFSEQYQEHEYYASLFETYNPSLCISAAMHVEIEAPPMIIAKQSGIHTVCGISSWDNLTSKGALFTQYDTFVVWSKQMAEELSRYYPESHSAAVHITGPAHFSWYFQDKYQQSREEFCQELGFDPKRPIILYGVATPHLAPNEHLVVRKLAESLATWPTQPQLIIRLHPTAGGGPRYLEYPYPGQVQLQVPKRGEQLFFPKQDDNKRQINTIRHADVVINLASTLTLDAAVCDRPVINIAYDLNTENSHQYRITEYYTAFDHYKTVVASGAVRIAWTHEALLEHIQDYLRDPTQQTAARKEIVALWCGQDIQSAGNRLGHALLNCLSQHQEN